MILRTRSYLHLAREELEVALRTGEFKVLSWAAAVSLALQYLVHTGK